MRTSCWPFAGCHEHEVEGSPNAGTFVASRHVDLLNACTIASARCGVTGGANTHACAVLSPALHRQPNSWTTSATSALILTRCPLRWAAASVGSAPSARVIAAGAIRSHNGVRGTTSDVVSTFSRGVAVSVACEPAEVGRGAEESEPEQPLSTITADTSSPRSLPKVTRDTPITAGTVVRATCRAA